jgi:hypothetical protein
MIQFLPRNWLPRFHTASLQTFVAVRSGSPDHFRVGAGYHLYEIVKRDEAKMCEWLIFVMKDQFVLFERFRVNELQ